MFAEVVKHSAEQLAHRLHVLAANRLAHKAEPRCVICALPVTSSFAVHSYRLYTCGNCDFVFLDPAVAKSLRCEALCDDDYFRSGGSGCWNYLADATLLQEHGNRYGLLLAEAGARRVLDVGAGAGFILRGLTEAGCSGVGIEPNASMAAHAVRELGLDVRTTKLEDFDTGEQFDAAVLLQVVDHLEDIRRSFARVGALTKGGGLCLIEFGNQASLTARILGPRWHEYAPPSVQRVFSLHALRLLLADYGFVLRRWGHPPKYLRADRVLSLLRYKADAQLMRAALTSLANVVPAGAKLRYLADDITWALFEKRY